jgi:D-glycero-D-manno-heptose 1,7-bisphosphate phosphatase
MRQRAVFFDRDDTLMANVPYLGDPAQVSVYPAAALILKQLREAGYLLFLVSNQSGVGRGLISVAQVEAVNREMLRQLGEPEFTHLYSCFEEPEQGGVYQRKPSPQLLYQAARAYHLDLSQSYFVGDRLGDVLAGRNAGCRTVLILSGPDRPERLLASAFADYVADDLTQGVAWIRSRS